MVEPLDAVIANGAMRGARRAIEETSIAVLESENMAVDDDVLGSGYFQAGCAGFDPFHGGGGTGNVEFV